MGYLLLVESISVTGGERTGIWQLMIDDRMFCVPEKPQGDHCGGAGTGVPGGGGGRRGGEGGQHRRQA